MREYLGDSKHTRDMWEWPASWDHETSMVARGLTRENPKSVRIGVSYVTKCLDSPK